MKEQIFSKMKIKDEHKKQNENLFLVLNLRDIWRYFHHLNRSKEFQPIYIHTQFRNVFILLVPLCPYLTVSNGEVSYSNSHDANGGLFPGAEASVDCNSDYIPSSGSIHQTSTTCQSSGTWNPEPISCYEGNN